MQQKTQRPVQLDNTEQTRVACALYPMTHLAREARLIERVLQSFTGL